MIGRWMVQQWCHHESLRVIAVTMSVMGIAWLRAAWRYCFHSDHRAPVRWYTGYVPPPFLLPTRWDLREFNKVYPSHAGPTADLPGTSPPEPGLDSE